MEFLHRVLGIAVIDNTGTRIFSKYYTCNKTLTMEKNKSRITNKIMELRNVNLQKTLENHVHRFVTNLKYHSSALFSNEILLIDGYVLIFQQVTDVTFIVIGDSDDNEEVLLGVLKVIIESLRMIINVPELNRRQLLLKYDALVLTVDELIEDGVILETDVNRLVAEVTLFTTDTNIETAHKALTSVNKYLRENL